MEGEDSVIGGKAQTNSPYVIPFLWITSFPLHRSIDLLIKVAYQALDQWYYYMKSQRVSSGKSWKAPEMGNKEIKIEGLDTFSFEECDGDDSEQPQITDYDILMGNVKPRNEVEEHRYCEVDGPA